MKKVIMMFVVMMLLTTAHVLASGLAIPEQGAASMGMCAAVTARSDDLSAIFYNPAGIDYVENFEVMLGITPIIPSHEFTPFREYSNIFSAEDSKSKTFLPPQLYGAFRVNSKTVLGLGVYAPFGLGTEWDDAWNGRYVSTFAEIQTIHINPTIAFSVNEMTTIGLGVSYVTSNATIEKMVDTGGSISSALAGKTTYDSHFGLEGDGTALAYNIGALIRPIENLQVGVSYRGAYEIEYEGTAKFTHKDTLKSIPVGLDPTGNIITAYNAVSEKMPASQDGKATLNMPWMLNFGMKYDITEVWDTSFDVNVVGWSVYDKLTIDFEDDKPMDEQTLEKKWKDSFVLRLGSSYDINESFVARCGLMFDKNPVPDDTFDSQLPDNDRIGVSLGGGYKIGNIQLDASYLLLNFSKREKDNGVGFSNDTTGDGQIDRFDIPPGYPVGSGKYDSRAHLFSISASYKF